LLFIWIMLSSIYVKFARNSPKNGPRIKGSTTIAMNTAAE
jgi:hypothetical protein